MTEPHHRVVDRLSQRAAGTKYRYAERVAGGALAGTLAALCTVWVGLWSLLSSPK